MLNEDKRILIVLIVLVRLRYYVLYLDKENIVWEKKKNNRRNC